MIFEQLFRYKSNDARSPLEDFLTELLAEWLRLVTEHGLLPWVLENIFALPSHNFLGVGLEEIIWETQHVIGPGYRGEGKRPDIVGRGPEFFLIIENKIGASFAEYDDDDGNIDQLSLYHDYSQARDERFTGIVLLTHFTPPPASWREPVVRWRIFNRKLHKLLNESESKISTSSSLAYFSSHFVNFMEKHGMSGTRIELSDIVSIPAYERLRSSLRKLCGISGEILRKETGNRGFKYLKIPHGGSSGNFREPNFFGFNLTPKGMKSDASYLIFWCGVITGQMYEVIGPETYGIPELSIGLAIWISKSNQENCEKGHQLLNRIADNLNNKAPNTWHIQSSEDSNNQLIYQIVARRSLIDIHKQAGERDWDDVVTDYFHTSCKSILTEVQMGEEELMAVLK